MCPVLSCSLPYSLLSNLLTRPSCSISFPCSVSGSFSTPARKSVYKTLERSGAACRFIDSVFSSGLEGELFGMGMWSLGLGAVGAALAGILLANTDLCLPKAAKASLEYLEDADLRSTTDDDKVIKAKGLWEKNGAVVMAVRRPG
uniref:Uncharacterized protein n=1 Tax=Lates calcarifer TaxID=8187 RepID=A0A4W6C705_LATCA